MRSSLSRSVVAISTALALATAGTTPTTGAESSLSGTSVRQTDNGSADSEIATVFGWITTALGTAAWIAELAYAYNFLIAHGTIQGTPIPGIPSTSSEFM